MDNIIKSREILNSVKTELIKLQQKVTELSKFDSNQSFIPVDLCTSTALTLEKLSAYEESLFEKISNYSQNPAVTISDAEEILNQAEREVELKLLKQKFDGIKTTNPNYDNLIEQLKVSAVSGDENTTERTIAEMIISDLLNNTCETAKNELVENSDYYRLAFAFNRNELFYEASDNSDTEETTDQNSDSDSDQVSSDDGSDEEPPPEPYSAENHQNEVFLDIDLERDEDFSDEKEFGLSLDIEPEIDSVDTANTAENISEPESGTDSSESNQTDNELTDAEPNSEELSYEQNSSTSVADDTTAEPENDVLSDTIEQPQLSDDDISNIIEEYKNDFEDNPTKLSLDISQSSEVGTKHNVTEIINMLSPKGRSARAPVKVFHVLMTELLLYGPKTEDDLYELPDFLKNRISNSVVDGYLQKLYNKGLISRISYDGNILYYFTSKGLKFNSHDRMISNFYCSDKRSRSSITKRVCRKVYPVSNISVCASVILSRIVKKYPYYLAIGSSEISVEGMGISVMSKPNIRNFALAYVSDDSANLEKLYENLKRSLQALRVFERINTMIVGSFTRIQAEAVYKVVEKSWSEKLVSTKIALYSYTEDKYFVPDTFEEFTEFETYDQIPYNQDLQSEEPENSALSEEQSEDNPDVPSEENEPEESSDILDNTDVLAEENSNEVNES